MGSGFSPLQSQVGGKESLFQIPATGGGGGGWTSVQRSTPHTGNQWARAFIDRRRGLLAERAESALTVIFRLGISGLISIILVVLGTVPGLVCSHFFEASSGIVAAYVMVII